MTHVNFGNRNVTSTSMAKLSIVYKHGRRAICVLIGVLKNSLLSFKEMHKTTSLPKGHVHFGIEDSVPRENSVLIKENNPGCIDIHLGFLQFNHNYRITLDIPKAYFLGYCLNDLLRAAEKLSPSVNWKIISLEEKTDHFHMTLEFYARKEKLLKEELNFVIGDKSVKLFLIARVLGEGKGTPLLKNEIKCIGSDLDEISESSDWAGFD